MTVMKVDDCDYAFVIADLMVLLDGLDRFVLKIWKNSEPTPVKFDENVCMTFLQEGVRFDRNNSIVYIFYDSIDSIEVIPK